MLLYKIKLCQKQLLRNLASVNLKLKKVFTEGPEFFALALLKLEVA